ncbi:MAG: beta-ketoacyl synthase N-terminal-like domain-containing protein [Myxococcota bacterium]
MKCEPDGDGIAIIGMACVFPQAPSLREFWHNIIGEVDAIGEPPPAWEAARYLDSGRIQTSAGGWLGELFRFSPHEFGIMPSSIDGGEPDQFLALEVARNALRDAGYLGADHGHRDTGIVLGHSTYLHRGQGTLIQNHIVVDQTVELLAAACPELRQSALDELRSILARKLPACTTDIAPGLVPNVMTGRIANRLDLRGPNYLVDAACSSSLLAVAAAIDELRAGRSSLMLAGGVNASLPPEVSAIFTQLGALSERGKVRPFESGSDGTLLGEGLGIVALKRLDDALRDGDRVYAVVRGVGQASDGRGKGLLAPTEEGETLAIERAYAQTGIDPTSIGLIEAHGTGIPLGDKTEIAALRNVFGGKSASECLPVGSVKSMISHCIPAAGIAGLIKTALALHHRVLPPTLCDEVNPDLDIRAPLYVNTRAQPWVERESTPRRAGINSFGFGGINTHAVVEQAPSSARAQLDYTPWSHELCVVSAEDREGLLAELETLRRALADHPEWSLDSIAAALAARDRGASHRLGFVVGSRRALDDNLSRAENRLRKSDSLRWSTRGGVVFSAKPLGGTLAFVFPGEGSQYLGMLADLAMVFPEVRAWLDFWAGLYDDEPGRRRTDIALPPPCSATKDHEHQLDARLHEMDVGSEAVFVGAQALHAALEALGIEPDVMLGHSSGESSALAASHAIPWESPSDLAAHVLRLNSAYRDVLRDGGIPTGSLIAVGALPLEVVEEHAGEIDPEIVVAMHNCREQLVLFGRPASMEALSQRLADQGGICIPLPFDRGYHTPGFTRAQAAFREYYDAIELGRPRVPLYSCATAQPFPAEPEAIRDLAAAQWSSRVRFADTVQRLHADGVTTFIEVGPSGNLTSFIGNILAETEHLAVASNLRRRSGVQQLLTVAAHMYTEARPVSLARLFEGRSIDVIRLEGDSPTQRPAMVLDNTMPKIRLSAEDAERIQALVRPSRPTPPAAAAPERAPSSEPSGLPTPSFGFLDTIVEHGPTSLVAQCNLDLRRHAFLRHHVLTGPVSQHDPTLSGLSCVPLMASLEIMAQACAALAGAADFVLIENVRATGWIALDEEQVGLQVQATVLDAGSGRYSAQLHGPSGRLVTAEFVRGQLEPQAPALAPLTEHRTSIWNGDELYTCGMFHGPLFQSIRNLEGWDGHGIDARLSEVRLEGFFQDGHVPPLVLNPVLLDATGQLAAYWIAQFSGVEFNCFPSSIERIELYASCPQQRSGLRMQARQLPDDPTATDMTAARRWSFECTDRDGQLLMRMVGLTNVYFSVPYEFYAVRRDPRRGWLGRPTRVQGRDDVLLWELPMLPEAFCAQSEGIFLRILASVFLNAAERQAWQALEGSTRYRRQWLMGRACIKEAVRYWIYHRTAELLPPAEIAVVHDDRGAPHADGGWRDTLVAAPSISLTHDAHACLAALVDPVQRVGVDRERLGRIRRPDLLREALAPPEKASLQGLDAASQQERLLRIWCAKEAAAKFLGEGLGARPAEFEVAFVDTANHQAHVARGAASVLVDLIMDDDSIIALASEPLPESHPCE